MTEPEQAVIGRLSSDFAVLASYLARASSDLRELSRIVAERSAAPTAAPRAEPVPAPWPVVPAHVAPAPPLPPRPAVPPVPRAPVAAAVRSEGWVGKALAVAGVAVTLIGVALLVVLAAQAGILAPGVRVAAGAVLSAALVGAGWALHRRPGGRVGAIALALTGIAAAYLDVIAVTTIYEWLPAAAGLVIASVVAGAGLTLARRWDSEHLGLLVLVPLIGLAPAVVGGITLLVVGFMLALSAAALPVQLGRDWLGLHAARVAAATIPLLVVLMAVDPAPGRAAWIAGACAIAAVLAFLGALLLLPSSSHPRGVALLAVAGSLPVLGLATTAGRVTSAVLAGALSAVVLGLVLLGDGLPGVAAPVRRIWAALSAGAALVAVVVAFDGPVAAPVLFAMALAVAVAGRSSVVARLSASAFTAVAALYYLDTAPLGTLVTPTALPVPHAVSTLISSVLAVGCAVVISSSWVARGGLDADVSRIFWAMSGLGALYAVTMFTVTAGVLVGGGDEGFFAGHVAATIVWIGVAAALLRHAVRLPRTERSVAVGGGMALVAAAMCKLFVFDLGTLDGIFRVVVFIVVGLALLGMGAGYARLLSQQDHQV